MAVGELDPQVGWHGRWGRAGEAAEALFARTVSGKAILDLGWAAPFSGSPFMDSMPGTAYAVRESSVAGNLRPIVCVRGQTSAGRDAAFHPNR